MMISILGDSVSTLEAYNPQGYRVFYDTYKQYENEIRFHTDTWWGKVIQALNGDLCINNSYSGSKVTGGVFPSASSVIRCNSLHTPLNYPDIILINIGDNDFGNGVPISHHRLSSSKDLSCFTDAYEVMLDSITHNYPDAAIVYATLVRSYIKDSNWNFPESFAGVPLEEYNQAIRKLKKRKNCYLADIGANDFRYETLDGSHPTKLGHQQFADIWIRHLKQLGFDLS